MGEDKKASKKTKKPKKEEKTEEKPTEGGGEEPKRATRATSNVFAMFPQNQIQEFKEAFTMMDQNRDGIIDVEDLKAIYQSVGMDPPADQLKKMIAESPTQLNFTGFLTLMGENLHGTDPENTILQAFCMFDEDNKGYIPEEYFKELMTGVGDIFSKDELKQTNKEAPIAGGQLDYKTFTKILKGSSGEDLV